MNPEDAAFLRRGSVLSWPVVCRVNENLTAGVVMRCFQGQGRVEMLSKRRDKKGLSLEAVARWERPQGPSCRGQVCRLVCLCIQHPFSLCLLMLACNTV